MATHPDTKFMRELGTIRTYAVTPELIRGARGLLGWTQRQLAVKAQIGTSTLADFERGARDTQRLVLRRLAAVLEGAGIRFVYGSREVGVLLQR